MTEEETLWEMDDHTLGKHAVLEAYLKAWLPIMGITQDRILFVDGFAGPGEYKGGEVGSPVIAMRALADHSGKGLIKAKVIFFFVELDHARYAHLSSLVEQWRPKLPSNAEVKLFNDSFENSVGGVLKNIGNGQVLIPSFVMIDPFGVGQTPMSIVHGLLKNPKVEVFISVMYDFINRFKGQPEFEGPLTSLFGDESWKASLTMLDGDQRRRFLYDLYKTKLRAGGARHVVHFDLYRNGRPVYAIFHATKHPLGCDKMKEAIWKIAPFGDYAFRSGMDDTFDLFGADLSPLKRQLRAEFGGTPTLIDDLIDFVASDRCAYYSGQLKGVLKEMEAAADLEVQDGTRKKRNTYPDGAVLTLRPL
jgi:three-Cys-motif partner protein